MAVKRCSDVRGSRLRHEPAGGCGCERDDVPTHEPSAVSSPWLSTVQGRLVQFSYLHFGHCSRLHPPDKRLLRQHRRVDGTGQRRTIPNHEVRQFDL
ncbi:hypothetical protein [Nostoc sp.]|uniref:hypothetical protein n=1 Tax=Nostoc sp. TaxID=1180 RepID=UPI002FFCB7F6